MIRKLKKKLTVLATVSMLVLMAVLVAMMNVINYSSVIAESDTILDIISSPDIPFGEEKELPSTPGKTTEPFLFRDMSPEVPYESRYFSVSVDENGTVVESNLSRIVSVDEDSAQTYIEKAMKTDKERGFVGQFRFVKMQNGDKTRILFLDCGRKLDAFHTFLWTSLCVGLLGCVIVFVAFLFAAGRMIRPIAESYEKQKRFISDAGHEIKTPLTIIRANVDLLACETEKEELTEIRTQTDRLAALTKDLVFLSKMEEQDTSLVKTACPLSDLIAETAASFRAPTVAKNIAFTRDIQSGIGINGSPDALRQLVCILLENAVKYTPEGGIIIIGLTVQKKNAVLTVWNTTAEKVKASDLPHLFDRFYRTDASRNSETGGHGIGLSIAKAICEAHAGTINAATKGETDFGITVSLPL